MPFGSYFWALKVLFVRAAHLSKLRLVAAQKLLTNKIGMHELLSHPKRLHEYYRKARRHLQRHA